MKLKMVLASMAVVFFLGAGASSSLANNSANANIVLQNDITEILTENLPREISNIFLENEWQGWTVTRAFVETSNNEIYYIVTLTKGYAIKEVKVSPEGVFVE